MLRAIPLLLMLAAAPAAAQERGRPIGLRAAVALAARRNPTLAASVTDVAIAEANVLASRGADDFLWDTAASWTRGRREFVEGTPVQQTKLDDAQLSTSLTRPLPTGGRVGLRASIESIQAEYATDSGAVPEVANVRVPSVQVYFSHPLLRGAGTSVARAPQRRARVARDAMGLSRDAVASGIIRDVVAAYWELVMAEEELTIRRTLTESAEQQLLAVQAYIAAQKQPPSASAEVLVAQALRQDDVIAAEEARRGQSIELARLLGLPLDTEAAALLASDPPDVAPVVPSEQEALAAAMASSPQIAAVRAQGRAAAIDVEVVENGLLPQLDLAISGGPRGGSPDAGPAVRQLGGFRSYDFQVALVLQEPLGRRAAHGALQAAEAGLLKARLNESDIESQVRSTVMRQVGLMDAARRRIEAVAHMTESATLDLAAEKARFEVGRATNFDVLRRQDELAQAQSRSMRARIDYLRAAAGLEALTGTILAHYGVTVR